jgi:NADPH-dependent 2,4-dienoyl-CoA reductase/sulfur reductase-like enzyme
VQPYSKLLIATGAAAVKPLINGLDLPGVFTLRKLSDARQIDRFIAEHTVRRGLIIGGGYIGLEMAEALHARGLEVTLVELLPQLMPNFDADMVQPVTAHLTEKGVTVLTGLRVRSVEQGQDQLAVLTMPAGNQQGGKAGIATDLIMVATGVRPNSELAKAAGLQLGVANAIWVDDHMCSSDPDIYAAGDCVAHWHLVLAQNAWIPLATSANKGGRIAGENMAGGNATFPGIIGTAVVKVFDYTMAVTGLTEQAAKLSAKFGANGEDVGATVIDENDRAGYWPGVTEIKVKLVFQKSSGRLLGGQIVGKDGVNKRIDIIATAIHARMTVMDLGLLDLSYAPPYSPPWDPVQVCANVAAKEVK